MKMVMTVVPKKYGEKLLSDLVHAGFIGFGYSFQTVLHPLISQTLEVLKDGPCLKSGCNIGLKVYNNNTLVIVHRNLPKSTHRERMEQNFDIFNFSLSMEDMTEIAKLNKLDRGQQ